MAPEIIFVKEVIRNPMPPIPCIVPVPPAVSPLNFLAPEIEPILAGNLLPLPPPPQPPVMELLVEPALAANALLPFSANPADDLPYFPVEVNENFWVEVDYIVGTSPLYVCLYNCRYQHNIPPVSSSGTQGKGTERDGNHIFQVFWRQIKTETAWFWQEVRREDEQQARAEQGAGAGSPDYEPNSPNYDPAGPNYNPSPEPMGDLHDLPLYDPANVMVILFSQRKPLLKIFFIVSGISYAG
jgi:hypothetical protein